MVEGRRRMRAGAIDEPDRQTNSDDEEGGHAQWVATPLLADATDAERISDSQRRLAEAWLR